jgi:MFS family permease
MDSDLMTRHGSTGSASRTEFGQHWPVVLACFATAIFAWGFGFYGQSVYLAELQRVHGWSSALISSATTAFYLMGAVLLARVHAVLERLGPRIVLIGGILLMGGGAILLTRAQQPWQLYPAAAVMALGWACSSSTAITTVLAIWFDRQRGLAISLALNGASAAGFTVAPALVALSNRSGLPQAALEIVLVGWAVLIPLILFGVGRAQHPAGAVQASAASAADGRPSYRDAREVLHSRHFWSVALPFSLVLAAQVGFLVHFVAFMLPRLGAGGTATAVSIAPPTAKLGRIALR